MPVRAVLYLREPFAFDGFGDDHRRPVHRFRRCHACQRVIDRGEVMAVDDQRAGAESLTPPLVGRDVPAEVRRAALSQPVHIDEGDQVVQLVIGRLVECFPHGAFGHLAVAAQHPDPVGQAIEVFPGQRESDAVGQPLAE